MKKSIIAASASAVALAAMPVVGVFADAADTTQTFTDTLTVNVEGSCTLELGQAGDYTDDNRTFSNTIAAGTIGYLNATSESSTPTGNTATVHCNTGTGNWAVTVSASTNALLGDASGTSIAPGNTFSGATSAWAIKSNAAPATGATITADNYSSYTGLSNSTFLTGPAKAGAGVTFNPSYKVYVSPDQAADAYTGVVTYTIDYTQQ